MDVYEFFYGVPETLKFSFSHQKFRENKSLQQTIPLSISIC